MRLNSAPLNTASLGGASSAIRLVNLVVSQAVRVVGAVTSPIIKYGRIACVALAVGALSGKRQVAARLSGAAVVMGSCGPRVLRVVPGAGSTFFAVQGRMYGTSRIRGVLAGQVGVTASLTAKQLHLVHGVLSITVGINGQASGLSTYIGPTDPDRIAQITAIDRVAYIQGA